ncbi:hypothetical protein NDU88_006373 [Pleurodeles waltl]|uniref:Uncharacterized protein n=1 Tax=Pleurodeles waltl TaxID=8319 RepID=A0AAV7TZY9_PLEWA|nr:hypothetical protein NDU88_006373 [Pleurodeles waltl]
MTEGKGADSEYPGARQKGQTRTFERDDRRSSRRREEPRENEEGKEPASGGRGGSYRTREVENILRGETCGGRRKIRSRGGQQKKDIVGSREDCQRKQQGREKQAKKPATLLKERGSHRYESTHEKNSTR